ncbi:hypothetical protein [Bradyrhizobium sp. BR 1432]|uniref:hypothetical protein n=1 Tax=Bradyrhizobium sp. BR 1432 TaxID=3447966 RepID=UPI003EE4F2CF
MPVKLPRAFSLVVHIVASCHGVLPLQVDRHRAHVVRRQPRPRPLISVCHAMTSSSNQTRRFGEM